MIPKKIHYCWFGGNPLPEKDKKCIESWKKFCPDYEIICHDESNYDISKNKFMKEAYDAKKWGFVPDFARLDIIYNEGGIYLDTDVEIIKNMDDLLDNAAFMGFEDGKHVSPGLGFAAEKKHPGIKKLLSIYDNVSFIKEDGSYNLTPSPILNTNKLIEFGLKQNDKIQKVLDITIYPTEYLCPKSFETGQLNITNNTYSIHHFNMSWFSEKDKKRQRINMICNNLFGKRIGKIVSKLIWYFFHPISAIKKLKK